MKICLISLDSLGYDKPIVDALQTLGHEAYHIDASQFRFDYPSVKAKVIGKFRKHILGKNPKKIAYQAYPIDALKRLGHMDKILIIRPDIYSLETHQQIKSYCDSYTAYLYDSCKRFDISQLLEGVFDHIFSFDTEDVQRYGFTFISNYIYVNERLPVVPKKYDCFTVMSVDERLPILNKLADHFDRMGINYHFTVVDKHRPKHLHPNIHFSNINITPSEVLNLVNQSFCLLDILREGHNGVSFRAFDALTYQKKLITTNPNIKVLGFYSSENIAVIDVDNIQIEAAFFKREYQPVPLDIYDSYRVTSWCKTVLNL